MIHRSEQQELHRIGEGAEESRRREAQRLHSARTKIGASLKRRSPSLEMAPRVHSDVQDARNTQCLLVRAVENGMLLHPVVPAPGIQILTPSAEARILTQALDARLQIGGVAFHL